MGYKIGIDVGGTFTDFFVVDKYGNFKIRKTESTPLDPAIGVLTGLGEIASEEGCTVSDFLSQVDVIVHGTTITTNAILTGKYAKTGFITTEGFRDYLNERRGAKTPYETKESPPNPIVPRYLIRVVKERVDCEGKEIIPLKEEDVYAAAKIFKREEVEAIAVSLLFSFLNPSHERKVKEILEKALPEVYICLSCDVLPQIRVYERASTTVFNACVGPIIRRYVDSLMQKLGQSSFNGMLLIMQSNGGVMSPDVVMNFAANTLLSGPAGGPQASMFFGRIHGIKNIISVDMGGTSFDVCLVRNMQPEITVENEIAGYRLATPSIAVHTIGAGGGSIAYIDPGGILRVGPQSAGAEPGPVCYGTGGVEPTITDADLCLGYLNPEYCLGGKRKLYLEKAEAAIKEKIAQPLGLDIAKAAEGIYVVANENMAQAIRMASIEKGYDPRSCLLVAAGGAGPVHICDIAKALEVPLILVPRVSSVFCAMGMLISNLRHDFVRVCYMLMHEGDINVNLINSHYKEMKEAGFATLKREGISPEMMQFKYSGDLRYEGQFTEIEIPFPPSNGSFTLDKLPSLARAFDEKHDLLYGYALPGTPLELLCLRVVAEGITEGIQMPEAPDTGDNVPSVIKAQRRISYNGKFLTVPVYDGNQVGRGNTITGPAVVEEPTTTLFITPEYELTCDRYSNYLIYPKGENLQEIIGELRT